MSDAAFFAAYAGVELKLPDGRTVTAKPIDLKTQVRFLRIAAQVASRTKESEAALLEFVEEFPKAVGLDEELRGLHLSQLFAVYEDFQSGTGLLPLPAPTIPSPSVGTT